MTDNELEAIHKSELDAAYDRQAAWFAWQSNHYEPPEADPYRGLDGDQYPCDRNEIVMDALRQRAAQAERERERALPVTEEWLRSIGFVNYRNIEGIGLETLPGVYLNWNQREWFRLDESFWDGETRGQVLDLLAALGVKGGA